MKLDFSEFDIQDLKAWSLAAEKALKGKPLDGLKWTVDQEITLNPFYTLDDSPKEPVDINTSKKDNDWWIGEQFLGEDPNSTNDLLRKSLSEGLNSPCVLDTENFEVCLEKVRVDFLWPIFKGGSFSNYIAFLNQQELEKSKLGGAYILYQADFDGIDISGTIDELKHMGTLLPNYSHSWLSIDINEDITSDGLSRGIYQLSELIHQLQSAGITPKIICEIECSNAFVKTVATIRALKLMMAQLCKVYNIPQQNIFLDAYVYQSGLDIQLGMIGATSQATAAVTAGVDRLTIECESLNVQHEEVVIRRMTRNVHHVMKMESGLDQIVDPAAGSYTIEKLTSEIAQRSWTKFQKMK